MAKKKKKGGVPQAKLTPTNYIKKVARKLPIVKCLINEDWNEQGVAVIYLMREKKNGELVGANYLVDVFCLGVKETGFMVDVPPYAFDQMVEDYQRNSGLKMVDIDAVKAQNIIYGAVEYAEDLGFKPAKEFDKVTVFALDNVDSLDYVDIEFGHEGKPFYIAGPRDDVFNTLETLSATIGEGNFKFYVPEQHPLSDHFYDGESDFLDGESELEDDFLDYEDVRPNRIFDFEDESEIYTFSDQEYAKETKNLGEDQTGFELDTKLGELYSKHTNNGAQDLNPDLQETIVAEFTKWAQSHYVEDSAFLDDLLGPDNIASTHDRIDYTLDSYESFLQSEQFKGRQLRDFILSAYIR